MRSRESFSLKKERKSVQSSWRYRFSIFSTFSKLLDHKFQKDERLKILWIEMRMKNMRWGNFFFLSIHSIFQTRDINPLLASLSISSHLMLYEEEFQGNVLRNLFMETKFIFSNLKVCINKHITPYLYRDLKRTHTYMYDGDDMIHRLTTYFRTWNPGSMSLLSITYWRTSGCQFNQYFSYHLFFCHLRTSFFPSSIFHSFFPDFDQLIISPLFSYLPDALLITRIISPYLSWDLHPSLSLFPHLPRVWLSLSLQILSGPSISPLFFIIFCSRSASLSLSHYFIARLCYSHTFLSVSTLQQREWKSGGRNIFFLFLPLEQLFWDTFLLVIFSTLFPLSSSSSHFKRQLVFPISRGLDYWTRKTQHTKNRRNVKREMSGKKYYYNTSSSFSFLFPILNPRVDI